MFEQRAVTATLGFALMCKLRQRALHLLQGTNALLDVGPLAFSVRPDLRARGSPADPQLEQFFDFFQSETKLLRSSDEADARHRFLRVKTIIGCGACRLWQESRAFVEPHRRNSDFSQTRGPTDRQSAPICVRCRSEEHTSELQSR